MAGLLHDIGKRFVMKFENKKGEHDTNAHFYHHENVSAYDSMFYLKETGFVSRDIIEICGFVSYHMKLYGLETEKGKRKLRLKVGDKMYDNLLLFNLCDGIGKGWVKDEIDN